MQFMEEEYWHQFRDESFPCAIFPYTNIISYLFFLNFTIALNFEEEILDFEKKTELRLFPFGFFSIREVCSDWIWS